MITLVLRRAEWFRLVRKKEFIMNKNFVVSEERLEACRKAREKMREEHLAKAAEELGADAADALRELLSLYDEKLYIWLAGLWQPEIGGFYHNESGRECENMLPDIESTGQALYFLAASGLTKGKVIDDPEAFPEDFKKLVGKFATSLLDPEDGYIYHPQWGKCITTSRKGRDLGWATGIYEQLKITPPYPTAIERLNSQNKEEKAELPEHLTDIEKFKAYLAEQPISTRSYYVGNLFQSQAIQIVAAGDEFVRCLLDWLEANQRDDNGLWQEKVNYDAVNGLMKIGLLYGTCKAPIPRPDQALESALAAALSDEPITFVCQFYNPLVTINNILNSFVALGRVEDEARLRARIRALAPELIRITYRKLKGHRVPENGAFTYNLDRSSNGVSQGMHVGVPGKSNGGVNGTCICANGTLRGLFATLGFPRIPLYCDEDADLFFDLIRNAKVHEKTVPYPGDDVFYAGKSFFQKEIKEKKDSLAKI